MGRYLGIDFGEKKIGLAVSDPLGLTAQPLGLISQKEFFLKIQEILKQFEVKKIILGLPINMNGTFGPQVERVKNFAKKIKEFTNTEVIFVDERLTSKEAEKFLIHAGLRRNQRKKIIDTSSAVLILTTYLDNLRRKNLNAI